MATPLTTARFIRRSDDHSNYALIQRFDNHNLAIVLLAQQVAGPEDVMTDGYVAAPADDPVFPGRVCSYYVVQDDGHDLEEDFEYHARQLDAEFESLRSEFIAEIAS